MVRSTAKYWVRMSDVSTVKHHVLQHLPVFQFNQGRDFTGDAQLINSGGFRDGRHRRRAALGTAGWGFLSSARNQETVQCWRL